MSEQPGMTGSQKPNESKSRRYILAVIIFLAVSLAATHTFLNRTSVGSPSFVRNTFAVYTATVMVVLALIILATILGRNLIKLYFEKKRGQLGSGFKAKMVRTFIVLSLLPALLLFVLAYSLISSSIDRWFGAPPAQMMEHSRALASQYYAEAEQRAKYTAGIIAGYMNSAGELRPEVQPELQDKLRQFCRSHALGDVRIYDRQAKLIARSGSAELSDAHRDTIRQLIGEGLIGRQNFRVERLNPEDPFTEINWATAPIRDPRGAVVGTVLTEAIHPQSAKYRADSVVEAYEKYVQLQRDKNVLRYNTLLILVLSTLLIIFAFSWFAMYLAKRITTPIQALAQGAAAVASGNLDHRVECQAFDELEGLVASFNRMTNDLQENEKRIELTQQILRQSSAEHADRRRYIETILQTIATGVISLDGDRHVRTMNRAAVQMLQINEIAENAGLEDLLPAASGKIIRELLHKAAVLGTVVRNIELTFPGKSLQIAATVTPLADNAGHRTGWVVVLDDMTELIRMEKLSAWQEVARRMAHEIKNPLTPIQLSAERILKRYREISPPLEMNHAVSRQSELEKFDALLAECVQAIIQEADSLKNLVDEFSRFARLPEIRLEDADVNRILENTLNLYNGRIQDVDVRRDLDMSIPMLRLDPEQMKRVFINLLDNALEAMSDNPHKKVLFLRTCCNISQGSARIEISDTGRGFPEEYQDSVFLPYFSKRKGGTGLGLAIVRQIVTDHFGNIRAEPNMPLGTRIIIDLPLTQG
ncbi:MAG: HAMP domain-containing protein [Acidobacteria bacterium]|nr:HAMP domain-containing protein [Acidobacteriota bacterium]